MTTLTSKPDGPTSSKTEHNQHEVRCGMCGSTLYVDEETFRFVQDAIKAGLDDPFRCAKCKEEYDDLAYEG
jgi:hypothetical protein